MSCGERLMLKAGYANNLKDHDHNLKQANYANLHHLPAENTSEDCNKVCGL